MSLTRDEGHQEPVLKEILREAKKPEAQVCNNKKEDEKDEKRG